MPTTSARILQSTGGRRGCGNVTLDNIRRVLSSFYGWLESEDRIVKNNFRKNETPCTCPPEFPVCVCGNVSKGKVITRKPILPGDKELEENKRSQSAKLRVFEKIY